MQHNTMKKITAGIIAVIILCFCLCVTSFALVYEILEVRDNYFHTGNVEINLNNGEPVIQEHEFIFEPGMTVFKDFFIENMSSWEVYYRLFFDNVDGALADVLEIRIQDGEKLLFSGKASEFTRENTPAADDTLAMGERRNLTIYFHYPEEAGNDTQGCALSFVLCAEATQTKNNPDKNFN